MAEYIERAPKCDECIHNGVCYMQEVCNDIEEQLREFGCDNFKPLAKVVEERNGVWVEITTHNGDTFDYDCVCNLCGESGVPFQKFCSGCGAKMNGGA